MYLEEPFLSVQLSIPSSSRSIAITVTGDCSCLVQINISSEQLMDQYRSMKETVTQT